MPFRNTGEKARDRGSHPLPFIRGDTTDEETEMNGITARPGADVLYPGTGVKMRPENVEDSLRIYRRRTTPVRTDQDHACQVHGILIPTDTDGSREQEFHQNETLRAEKYQASNDFRHDGTPIG